MIVSSTHLSYGVADTANGIGDLFAKKIHTEKICLKKLDGGEYCVNGDDLEAIIRERGEVAPVIVGPTQDVATATSSTDTATTTEIITEPDPLLVPNPTL